VRVGSHHEKPLEGSIENIVYFHLRGVGVGQISWSGFQRHDFAVFFEKYAKDVVFDHISNLIKLFAIDNFLVPSPLVTLSIFNIVDSPFEHPTNLMRHHIDELFEVILVGVGPHLVIQSFDIDLPLLYKIPLIVAVHILVS
jgi:hypothetical protein